MNPINSIEQDIQALITRIEHDATMKERERCAEICCTMMDNVAITSASIAMKQEIYHRILNPPAQTQEVAPKFLSTGGNLCATSKPLPKINVSNRFTFEGKEYEDISELLVGKDWLAENSYNCWQVVSENQVGIAVKYFSSYKFARPITSQPIPSTIDEDARKEFEKWIKELGHYPSFLGLGSSDIYREGFRAGRTQGGV